MAQEALKVYQKKLFEYDYTIKKIDTILISGKIASNLREHYQLSREACQRLKSKCSQEMSEYARKNRLSILLPPLSKEEKDDLIRSLEEKREGEISVNIKFDNLRPESEYSAQPEEIYEEEKSTVYITNRLTVPEENRYIDDDENDDLEIDDDENDDLEIDDDENDDLEIDDDENDDLDNIDTDSDELYNDKLNSDMPDNNLEPEVADFIRELKKGMSLFYGS